MGHSARHPSRQAGIGRATRQYACAVTSLALAWTCTAVPARAGEEPLTWSPEALALDAKGDELARARDYAAAHEAYRAAYRAMPDPVAEGPAWQTWLTQRHRTTFKGTLCHKSQRLYCFDDGFVEDTED